MEWEADWARQHAEDERRCAQERHAMEYARVLAQARHEFGENATVYDCPICASLIVDRPWKPGERPDVSARHTHVRSHGCTCGPGVSGFCPFCREGEGIGVIPFNAELFGEREAEQRQEELRRVILPAGGTRTR